MVSIIFSRQCNDRLTRQFCCIAGTGEKSKGSLDMSAESSKALKHGRFDIQEFSKTSASAKNPTTSAAPTASANATSSSTKGLSTTSSLSIVGPRNSTTQPEKDRLSKERSQIEKIEQQVLDLNAEIAVLNRLLAVCDSGNPEKDRQLKDRDILISRLEQQVSESKALTAELTKELSACLVS